MRRQKPKVIIILDAKTFEVEHVYVGTTRKEAMTAFLRLMQGNIDAAYSDMKEEFTNILERYQITELEPNQVSIRRGGGLV